MITNNLSTLTINKLTKDQYERELAAGNIDDSALYLTPEESVEGWGSSDTTEEIAGWYRIAKTRIDINNNIGTFYIINSLPVHHTTAIINAGISFGKTDGILLTQAGCSYSGNSLSIIKVRIVYSTTYSGNYAYLEIYCPFAIANQIKVQFLGLGWIAVNPMIAGYIPTNYLSKEITLVGGNDTIVANLYGNANTATKSLQDNVGQQIDATYIKDLSIDSKVITYTKGNNTSGTITIQSSSLVVSDTKPSSSCIWFNTQGTGDSTAINEEISATDVASIYNSI